MRQNLRDHWSIGIDDSFSDRETDDGYQVFEKPGMRVWCAIYIDQSPDPAVAFEERFDAVAPGDSEDPRLNWSSDGVSGRATVTVEANGIQLHAFSVSCGSAASLDFELASESSVDEAIQIWKGLRHSPPA